MDPNDCILTIFVYFNEKSLNIKLQNIISINELKEYTIKQFRILEKYKKYMKFICNYNNQIIENDIDLINYCNEKSLEEYVLEANLLIDNYNKKEIIDNYSEYKNIIDQLKKENEEIKEKLNYLKEENMILKQNLSEKVQVYEALEQDNTLFIKKIEELENNIKEKTKIIENLNEKIKSKYRINSDEIFKTLYKEINELKIKLSRYPIELLEGEKLINFTIMSNDENVRTNILCKNTDKFVNVENIIYEKYPEYFDFEYYFTINGKKINKRKTVEENNINNNDIIIMKLK